MEDDFRYVLTSEQMKIADQTAIRERGIPGIDLMEAAARGVVREVLHLRQRGEEVAVLVGPGNNGGDGIAVARMLHLRGIPVRVLSTVDLSSMKGEAAEMVRRLAVHRVAVDSLIDDEGELDESILTEVLGRVSVAVDALLGTGIEGSLRHPYDQIIAAVNRAPCRVVSVDVPSGCDADSGMGLPVSVMADVTVTFGAPKPGILLEPGNLAAGRVVLRDIGLPRDILREAWSVGVSRLIWTHSRLVRGYLPERSAVGHKGTFGHLTVVGGSRGFTGAPTMTAEAALRTGAGTVTCVLPDEVQDIVAGKLTEAMTVGLPTMDGDILVEEAADILEGLLGSSDALAIGPGLGRGEGAREMVLSLLEELGDRSSPPVVIDADAINALAPDPGVIRTFGLEGRIVLTPHPGEMARLVDEHVNTITEDRAGWARRTAVLTGGVVLLKGAPAVVASPGGTVAVNSTGNVGLATGGSGDVLTGIVAALLAEGAPPWRAAVTACHVHGRAADIAVKDIHPRSLLPRDVTGYLSEAFVELESEGLRAPGE
ncbi:MAG: NAD(P)H-hydrate dehydratase [Bacillota bacterium]